MDENETSAKLVIQEQIERITAEVSSEREIPGQKLRRLRDLLDARDRLLGKTTSSRLIPLALVAIGALLAGAAFAFRVPYVQIVFVGKVSSVSFETSDRSNLSIGGAMNEVSIRIDRGELGITSSDATCLRNSAFVEAKALKTREGVVGISKIVLPSRTTVDFQHGMQRWSENLQIRFGDDASESGVELTMTGPIRLVTQGCAWVRSYTVPTVIGLAFPGRTTLSIGAVVGDMERVPGPGIPVSKFNVLVSEFGSARSYSSIESGTIFFDEYEGRDRKLREGEIVRFGGSSEGIVELLTATEKSIDVRYSARVKAVLVGGGAGKDLTPTIFEFLSKKYGVATFWTAALYIAGLLFSLRKWTFEEQLSGSKE